MSISSVSGPASAAFAQQEAAAAQSQAQQHALAAAASLAVQTAHVQRLPHQPAPVVDTSSASTTGPAPSAAAARAGLDITA